MRKPYCWGNIDFRIAREVLGLKTFFFSTKTYLFSNLRDCKCKNGVTGSIYSSWGAGKKLPYQWHFIASFYVSRLFVAQLPSTHRHSLLGRSKAGKKSFESSTIFHNFCYVCVFVFVTSMLSFNSVHHYSTQTFPCILVLLKLTFFAQFILWPMPPCINATISIIKTFPKAQRTRGLSSYHKFKHKPWSKFIFRISTKHQKNSEFP